MNELVWLNGQVLPLSQATVSIEDRGFQFADGVYEVIRVYNGRAFTIVEHMDRLERSCAAIAIRLPLARSVLVAEIEKLIGQTGVQDGMVYLQVTRGQSPRNHAFPEVAPTLLFYVRGLPPVLEPGTAVGVKLLSVPDERWKKCHIKSIALLANILAKNTALAAGADEAVFVENGIVTECSASNICIIAGGKLITHPAGPKVLPGITRLVLTRIAPKVGVAVEERPVTLSEAMVADEVFITSTTRELSWVAQWDERTVKPGQCGPLTKRLHRAYQEEVRAACG